MKLKTNEWLEKGNQQTSFLSYSPWNENLQEKYLINGKNKRGDMEIFHKVFSEVRVISTIDKPKGDLQDVSKLQKQL